MAVVALFNHADSLSLHETKQLLVNALLELFGNGRLGRLLRFSSDISRGHTLHLLLSSFGDTRGNTALEPGRKEITFELIRKVSVLTSIAIL